MTPELIKHDYAKGLKVEDYLKLKLEQNGYLNPENGCLEWTGYISYNGYGRISYLKKAYIVHRMAYEFRHGPIGNSRIFVCHTCDNRKCFKDEHLFLGTNDDNMKDMAAKGRAAVRKGSVNPRARLSDNQVLEIYNSNQHASVLAMKYGISKAHLWDIKSGRRWGHLTQACKEIDDATKD